MRLARAAQWAQRRLLGLLFALWRQPAARPPKRLLLVELTRLGDLVAASSLIDPLRAAFPGAELCVVGDVAHAGLFAGDKRVRFIGFPRSGWAFLRAAWDLAPNLGGPEALWVIASPASRNSLLAYLAKPGLVAGYLLPSGGLGYDETSPLQRRSREQGSVACGSSGSQDHLVTRAGKALACLLAPPTDLAPRLLAQAARDPRHVVLHAGANWAWRRWPLERFVALGQALRAQGLRVTLIPAEAGEPVEGHGLELSAPVDLKALRELLASAGLFIGNDSGPLHLAAALGTPCLGLYGPNSPGRSGPWPGSAHRVLREPVPCSPCAQTICVQPHDWCMAKLEADQVLQSAQTLLGL